LLVDENDEKAIIARQHLAFAIQVQPYRASALFNYYYNASIWIFARPDGHFSAFTLKNYLSVKP
jgi:hypothetical protein